MSALTLAQQEALYTAITEGDTEATAVLLKQCEADINGRPFAGLTADMAGPESTCLHLAACYAKPGVVESLLSQAADPTATADGATPAEALAAAEEAAGAAFVLRRGRKGWMDDCGKVRALLQAATTLQRAEAAKTAGNEAFKAGNYLDAIDRYTACIKLDDTNVVYFSNRSIALCKIQRYDESNSDADRCIAMDPAWSKGYIRKATAQRATGDLDAARATLEAGLKAVPRDTLLSTAMESLGAKEAEQRLKGNVVDFAVNKNAGETALKDGNYDAAKSSYASSLNVMESMLDKLPPDKAAALRAQLASVRSNMSQELGKAAGSAN